MLCTRCGLVMLDGFKFCHHCGTPVSIVTAAPEPVVAAPEQTEGNAPLPEPIEVVNAEETPAAGPDLADADISVGSIFLLDLLCYIPLVNLILLAVMASSGRGTSLREIARGKLLAMMTVTLIVLSAALILILLMYTEIIEPIYLGWWRP